jgi:hypothetical protein
MGEWFCIISSVRETYKKEKNRKKIEKNKAKKKAYFFSNFIYSTLTKQKQNG